MTTINTHFNNLNINNLNSPIKDTGSKRVKKQNPPVYLPQETFDYVKDTYCLRAKG